MYTISIIHLKQGDKFKLQGSSQIYEVDSICSPRCYYHNVETNESDSIPYSKWSKVIVDFENDN
jgi:hypothetical protein